MHLPVAETQGVGQPREMCLHDCGQMGLPFAGGWGCRGHADVQEESLQEGEGLQVKPPVIGAMDERHRGVTIWEASGSPRCISCGFGSGTAFQMGVNTVRSSWGRSHCDIQRPKGSIGTGCSDVSAVNVPSPVRSCCSVSQAGALREVN